MSAKLIITNSETGRSNSLELLREETRLGRAADLNDILLDDAQVSRHHAVIKRSGDTFRLVDPGSANGTFINGERIAEHLLKDGDSFAIGKYTFQFKYQPTGISIKFDEHKKGATVVMRAPSELNSIIPKIDTISGTATNTGSLLEYVEVLRKKAETLARIYELNQMLGSDFSQEAIFKKVSEMVFRLTPADSFLVLLKDAGTGELAIVAAEFRNPDKRPADEQITISRT